MSLYNYYFSPRFGREQWAEVAAYLGVRAKPDDLVVFHAGYMEIAFDYYADRLDARRELDHLPRPPEVAWEGTAEQTAAWETAGNVLAARGRIWVVVSHAFESDHPGEVLNRLRDAFPNQLDSRRFPRQNAIEIYLMGTEKRAPPPIITLLGTPDLVRACGHSLPLPVR